MFAKMFERSVAKTVTMALAAIVMCCALAAPAMAQNAPYYSPEQLDHLVARIALHPDPLLAQILAASTFPDQIQDATHWADQHHYLTGDALAQAISNDQLPWDPSVQALLPFPTVLELMANDMNWTTDMGNAFLAQQQDVMDAVQRMRRQARDYGYLRTGPQIVVSGGPYISIQPVRPDYIVVPYYDPVVVYARPRPGFFVGAAIGFRFGVGVGVAFRPWGWGLNRIAWNQRVVVVNNAPWRRTWVNRTVYVHPYAVRRTVVVNRPVVEHHELIERSERERSAGHYGHERVEEHRDDHRGHDNHGHDGHDDHGHHDDHH